MCACFPVLLLSFLSFTAVEGVVSAVCAAHGCELRAGVGHLRVPRAARGSAALARPRYRRQVRPSVRQLHIVVTQIVQPALIVHLYLIDE